MVLLPSLVLGAKVKGPRVLEIGRKHDSLVAGFPRKLDTQVPGIERNKDKVQVLGRQMLRGEGVEPVDGVSEGAGVTDMFPRQGCQARWWRVGQRRSRRSEARRVLLENWVWVVWRELGGRREKKVVLTAERRNGGIDGLNQDALTMQLAGQFCQIAVELDFFCRRGLTSSSELASSKIQPNSITSAESFVTYTPCSSQVVATWMTTYLSTFRGGLCCEAMAAETNRVRDERRKPRVDGIGAGKVGLER